MTIHKYPLETDVSVIKLANGLEVPPDYFRRREFGMWRREFLERTIQALIASDQYSVSEAWDIAEAALREGQRRGHLP